MNAGVNVGWLILGGLTLWLLWPHIRDGRELVRELVDEPRLSIVDPVDPWDDYLLTLGPGDVIVSPHGVDIELADGWTAEDVVQLLADLDTFPEVEPA